MPTIVKPALAQTLLTNLAADLDEHFGGGAMSVAAYDTAWVARIRRPDNPKLLAFPYSLEWLLNNQASDGSWSSPAPYSLLPTLAALLTLTQTPVPTARTQEAASHAATYLRHALPNWSIDNHESVGFEVLAPGLLVELEAAGWRFDFPAHDALLELYRHKLAIAPPEMLYTGQSNLIHSLEAFGANLDFNRLRPLQASNGAYGNSPAATAAVLIHRAEWNMAAASWLQHLTDKSFVAGQAGGMPNAYPIDAFEASWVLYNLAHAGLACHTNPLVHKLSDWLCASLTPAGASISRSYGMPTDADDTGMVIAALRLAGVNAPLASLFKFEREAHFACFEFERGISLSANAHVLAALLTYPDYTQTRLNSLIDKATSYLLSVRNNAGFWTDKWHVSPFYATACCVLALAAHPDPRLVQELRCSANWLLTNQNADGGWGTPSTLEESAYALQSLGALAVLADNFTSYQTVVARGRTYLEQQLAYYFECPTALPKLWRGKELYVPAKVVLSAAIAALNYSVVRL